MEQIELEHFKRIMERLVAELQWPYYNREDLVVEEAADALDQVGNAARRDLAARELELRSKRFHELRAALRRIENRTYGLCLECEAEIGIKRLAAVPWTRYCIICQESADQNGHQAEPSWNPMASVLHR
jgi:DnaK suppressor protein